MSPRRAHILIYCITIQSHLPLSVTQMGMPWSWQYAEFCWSLCDASNWIFILFALQRPVDYILREICRWMYLLITISSPVTRRKLVTSNELPLPWCKAELSSLQRDTVWVFHLKRTKLSHAHISVLLSIPGLIDGTYEELPVQNTTIQNVVN